MVGDDDEVKLEHAVEMYRALPAGELASSPARRMGCWQRNPSCAAA
jgi:hypothetical protein